MHCGVGPFPAEDLDAWPFDAEERSENQSANAASPRRVGDSGRAAGWLEGTSKTQQLALLSGEARHPQTRLSQSARENPASARDSEAAAAAQIPANVASLLEEAPVSVRLLWRASFERKGIERR